MTPISFYPGPSTVYAETPRWVQEAYDCGILAANHRSNAFMDLSKDTKQVLRDRLLIPVDYEILFISSATEGWEVLTQSLTREVSQHFYNGAFGQKWASVAENLGADIRKVPFEIGHSLPAHKIDPKAEWLCVTACETSNGTMIDETLLAALAQQREDHQLIAVDATSALGGIFLDFQLADYWFGSCQKCLGLPAGLGLLIVSPRAMAYAESLGERAHYNSFLTMLKHARHEQTHYTPNVLNIYLLWSAQQAAASITLVEQKLRQRMTILSSLIYNKEELHWLVDDELFRSQTVATIKAPNVSKMKAYACANGILVGNGYGEWKESTFRIANFPAIADVQFDLLCEVIKGS